MGNEKPGLDGQGSLGRATVHGVLWMTAGRVLKAPLNLVTIAVLARLLTPSDFGVVAIAVVVMGLATLLVDGSSGMVLIQRAEVTPSLVGASLLLSAVLASLFAVGIIAAGPLIEGQFDFQNMSEILIPFALILPISAAMAISTALLQRGSQFGVLAINSFVAQAAYGIIAIALAFAGFGLWSLVWSQIASVCIETLLCWRAARARYPIAFSRSAIGDALRSGGMFTVTKLLNWAAGNVDRIVVGKLLGASALGYYSRASSLMLTLNQLLGTGAMRVLFSTFSRMQDDRARLTSGFDRALSTGLIGSTLASVFVVMFADLIVDVLLGPGWQSATPLMQALFAAFVARSGYVVAEAVPLALGLGRQSAVRQAIHLVLVCAGAVTGARYALVGAAVGIAIAYWIFYLICLGLVMRLIDVSLGRLFRIHSSALLVAPPPGVIAAGAAWLLGPGQSLMLRLVPPLLFGAIAVFMIAFGPASLLSQDLARIRQTAIGHIRSRLARQGRAAV